MDLLGRIVLAVLVLAAMLTLLTFASGDGQSVSAFTYLSHGPVVIEGNSNFTATNGIVAGSGAASDPYIIQGWDFKDTPVPANFGLFKVYNTSAYFVIRNIHSEVSLNCVDNAIFHNVTHAVVEDSLFSGCGYANLLISDSSEITIKANGFSSPSIRNVNGVYVYDSSNITIISNSFFDEDGVYLEGSKNVLVYQNNFYASASDDSNGQNFWDNGYPNGGNYWYYYQNLTDVCSGPTQTTCNGPDGIADKPHTIVTQPYTIQYCPAPECVKIVDRYPLVRPNSLAPDNVPPVPGRLEASLVNPFGVTLSWTKASDDFEIAAYRVYECSGYQCTKSPYKLLATLPASASSYGVTGLVPGEVYVLLVEAGDAAGNWSSCDRLSCDQNVQTVFPPSLLDAGLIVWGNYWYAVIGIVLTTLGVLALDEQFRNKRAGQKPLNLTQQDWLDMKFPHGTQAPLAFCVISAILSLTLGGLVFAESFLNGSSLLFPTIFLAFGAFALIGGRMLYLRPRRKLEWSIAVLVVSLIFAFAGYVIPEFGGGFWFLLSTPYSILGGLAGLLSRRSRITGISGT